jgi:predicted SAM-dependent methyltransferase
MTHIVHPEDWGNRLPLEFDHEVYVNHPGSRDLARFDEERALLHYKSHGMAEGRICSEVKSKKDFISLVPAELPILEIGPFFSPAFRRPKANVYYVDCLSTESMRKRAEKLKGGAINDIPEIDYVWKGQRYADLIGRKFSAIYSSHNIEHQPCLVTHLRDLESVLEEEGAVFLAVPDKRYCFDHFFPETNLADVVEAWAEGKRRHRLKDVLEHRFFAAHNEPVRHWRGDHGEHQGLLPLDDRRNALFMAELERLRSSDEYTDVHAWKFTPATFRTLIENLYSLELTRLRIARVYPTVKNSNEFYAVMVFGRS